MTVNKLYDIFELLKGRQTKKIIVVCAHDKHTLISVSQAADQNLIRGILIGNYESILSICKEAGIDSDKFTIINQPSDELAAQIGVAMINQCEGDILMKGLISTDKFMRAILNKEKGLVESGKIVSHVTLIENKNYHKLLIVADVAVIPLPDLNQKIQIIKYLVDVATSLKIAIPKIAVLTPTEQVIPSIVSTIDAALLSKMNERGQIRGCIVEGPLALDVAIDHEAAEIKGLSSSVSGDADCLLFPNLESGNIFYKVNTKLAGSESAAILVGTKIPVVLASRGDSVQVKLNSIALGVLLSYEKD